MNPARPATYFADTSFWIALFSKLDRYHGRAVSWRRHLSDEKAHILTTEAVLWEWMNALAASGSRRTSAEGYRRCHRDPQIEVLPFTDDAISRGVQLYEERSDKDWSLTDCLSFVEMSHRQISLALTADRHFQQAGFDAVLLNDPP